MATVTSRDGTTIAFEKQGQGPALILVDGALSYRDLFGARREAELLARHFTVYIYDRRGRGQSSDTPPYVVAHEIEDLDALITAAGGSAYVYGHSSGAALALEAAAIDLPITKLAMYEPPYIAEAGALQRKLDYTEQLTELLATGLRADAVDLFLALAGMSADEIAAVHDAPYWPQLEAIAPTLGYDNLIMADGTVPRGRTATVTVPTLVAAGGASPEVLRQPALAVAEAIPGALHATLEGQTHDVVPEILTPVLANFFTGTDLYPTQALLSVQR